MRKIVICLICLVFITGCTNNVEKNDFTLINANEAYKMIRNEEVIIIDVRSKEEYDTGHLKNSVNIPHTDIEDEIEDIVKDLNEKIIIYCRSGARANAASSVLAKLGYKNVYTFGGLDSWDYELVK